MRECLWTVYPADTRCDKGHSHEGGAGARLALGYAVNALPPESADIASEQYTIEEGEHEPTRTDAHKRQ